MESPTELFIEKFFRWPPHFSTFESPNRNPPNWYMPFQRPITLPPSPETSSGDKWWTQSLITNFLSFNLPQCESNHHKQDFSLLAPASNYKVIKFPCYLRSAWISTSGLKFDQNRKLGQQKITRNIHRQIWFYFLMKLSLDAVWYKWWKWTQWYLE